MDSCYSDGAVGVSRLGPGKQHEEKTRELKADEPTTLGIVSGVDCSRCMEPTEEAAVT